MNEQVRNDAYLLLMHGPLSLYKTILCTELEEDAISSSKVLCRYINNHLALSLSFLVKSYRKIPQNKIIDSERL